MLPRVCIAFALVVALLGTHGPAFAQEDKAVLEAALNKRKTLELLEKANEEYRVFLKRPETPIEFWSAIKFEMDLGKFDLAGLHLKMLLEKAPPEAVDKELVKLEQAEGMTAFLRLRQVRTWSDHPPFQKESSANVERLIDRVTGAVEKHLSDPDRIKKFISRLDAPTPEERGYAYVQIARARERAVPYLIEALRVNNGKPLFSRVRETLLRMGPETVPVYLEAFKAANDNDFRDLELRLTLLDLVKQRDDKRVVPYLWHMYASKKYPDAVRKRAKETLASLLRTGIEDMPAAKDTLVYLAERYYQHKMPFEEGKSVKLWPWDGQTIALKPVELTPYQAEEFFGMRYARQALDLDSSYLPAQVVLLSLMLERYYRPKLDQIVTEPLPPKMHQLLTSIDSELMMRVMERAMDDKQIPVILPLIQALGERGEFRAVQQKPGGQPRGLLQALYYPDRRVQFLSMKAMLRMPDNVRPLVASNRIVDLSRRFLASDAKGKVLVVLAPVGAEQEVEKTVKDLGFEPVFARKIKEAVDLGRATADIDLVILHKGMPEQEFSHTYSQLRSHYDLGGLPMIVVVTKERERTVKKLLSTNPNAVVVTEERFKADDDLKNLVETQIKRAQIAKLAPAERKEFARLSMDTLWRIGRGEFDGYDIMPALDVIAEQLKSKDYALEALEILGRMPGRDVQYRLARVVGDPARDLKLRMPASIELNRHLQKNGVLLDKKLQDDLRTAHAQAAEGEPLRVQLNITMSMLTRPNAPKTGADLTKFRPDPPPAPKVKKDN